MGKGIESIVSDVGNIARDTSSFFTGGTSGVNVGRGEAPTEQTLMTDASGLAAGAGLAGAGLGSTAAGGSAAGGAAGGSGSGLNAILYPQASQVPGAGISLGTPAAVAGSLVNYADPAVQALMTAGGSYGSAASGGGIQGTGSISEGGASGGAANVAPSGIPPGPGGAGPGAGGGVSPAVTGTQGADRGGMVDQILSGMRKNAGLAQLGLAGASLAMAGGRKSIPNEGQLNDLAASGSQAAKDLIASYRTGQLSAGQQAGLDQLTQNTKNQINSYFASIGQSDSTAHMQALAQVDQQALGMKQQMLDNMLTQGLNAIGVASGPLATVADYQIKQDKNLTDAFGNFANAVGNAFGKQAGTQAPPPPKSGQAGTGSGVGTTTQSFDR